VQLLIVVDMETDLDKFHLTS